MRAQKLTQTVIKVNVSVLSQSVRVSHASWNDLDFFLENSRTWKVLENHFGSGKSWKLKLKVLEKNS